MSTQENGIASNVSRPTSVAIASTTVAVATPIVVTTSAPHLLTTGDTVFVRGVLHDIPANGVFVVTVIDATNVSLDGSVGSGAGGAEIGATIQSLGFNSTFAIPADVVDALNAASVNVAFEALADRTALLGKQFGRYYLVDHNVSKADDDTDASWSSTVCTGAGAWGALNTPAQVEIIGARTGDLIEIQFNATYSITSGGTHAPKIALGWQAGLLGTPSKLLSSAAWLAPGSAVTDSGTAHIGGLFAVPSSPSGLDYVTVLAYYWSASGPTLDFLGDYNLSAKLWRAT